MEATFIRNIARWHQRMGKSAEEIASEQHLSLGEVYTALAYYFNHKTEIDPLMDEGRSPEESNPNSLAKAFVRGIGSVLEFFPSTDRFNAWRLTRDVTISEWPSTVREMLADVREESTDSGASA